MSDQDPTPPAPTPAGWYPDPQAPGQQRYWDGTAWTTSAPGSAAPAPGVAGPMTSTKAIIGLVLAILSWPLCPIIAAIPALILAHASDKEITASEGRLEGAGLNTATRIIAWLNIAVSIVAGVVIAVLAVIGVIFTAEVASTLDPSINSKTGLADGQYALDPSRRVNFDDECSYGGTVSMPGNPNVGDVTVYGSGPVECPNLVEVQFVLIDVTGGIARIISVE